MKIPAFIQKKVDKIKEEEKEWQEEQRKEQLEQAKNEHPEDVAFQATGIIFRSRNGDYSIDKQKMDDVLQIFAGQKVKIMILHADHANLEG